LYVADQALKARFNPLVLDVNRAFSADVFCAMLAWGVAPRLSVSVAPLALNTSFATANALQLSPV
jgi:hypothetical protein